MEGAERGVGRAVAGVGVTGVGEGKWNGRRGNVFASSFRLLLLIAMLTLLLDHFKSFATFFIIYHFIERESEQLE